MKKNFITGVLLLAVTAGGFSTFTSCKDTDEDRFIEIDAKNASLQAALDELKTKLANCSSSCKSEIARLEQLINSQDHFSETTIKEWIAELTNKYALQSTVDDLIERIEKLENAPKDFNAAQVAALISLAANASQLNALVGPNGTIATIQGDITDIQGDITDIQGDITNINNNITKINGDITNINNNITEMGNNITLLQEALFGTATEPGLVQTVAGMQETVEGLGKWFENIGMTVEEFQENVKAGEFVRANEAALQALVNLQNNGTLNETALQQLNLYANDLAGIDEMYKAIFENAQLPEGETEWWSYATVMTSIKENAAAIAALQEDVDALLNRINDMVTSLVLQASTNPVFGSFNSPLGINSMVLMTYYGHLTTGVRSFPAPAGRGAECYGDYDIDWSAITSDSYTIENTNLVPLDENGMASLGNFWFTVNPGTVNHLDTDGFALVNSREDEPLVKVTGVNKDDETLLTFGIGSRAAGNGNGLYTATASVAPENLDAIKINIEPGLKEAFIDAVRNRTAADAAHLMKAIYTQLKDVCPANALRYTYTAKTGKAADGTWITEPQKVYSNYGMAATAFKPLNFSTLKGDSFRHLPVINPIELDKSLVDMDFTPFKIGEVTLSISLKIEAVEIDPVGNTIITVKVPNQYNVNVDETGSGTATLPDNWENTPGMYSTITVDISDDLNAVIDEVRKAIDHWINGVPGNEDKQGLNQQINAAIQEAVDKAFNGPNGLIADLENQVNTMMGNIQDHLYDLVDKINGDYLHKVNRLLERYKRVADRINKVLDDPNHYLQTVMFYRTGDGNLAIVSGNDRQPSQFKGDGDAIELFATTYNFETVCPTFKKIVGVTKVVKGNADGTVTECPELARAANASMAKVMPGDKNRVALDVAGATNGVYTYEIVYQALDYSGFTSTHKYYVQVVRK